MTLAALWTSTAEQEELRRLEQGGAQVVARPMPAWRSAANSLLALPTRTPLQAVYSWQPGLFAALLAAHAANCAAEQGAFWPMHDQLFQGAAAQAWGSGDTADFGTFVGYAAALHLDAVKLQECVQANRYAAQIEADFRDAAALGVRSTPSFVVNGKLLVGAQPFDVWKDVLDGMLAEQ